MVGGAGGGGRGAGRQGGFTVPTHARLHGVCRNGLGGGRRTCFSFVLSFFLHARFLFFCNSLGAHHIFLGQARAEAKGACGVPPLRGQRT